MQRLKIFSAIFFLLFSLTISNFVSANSQSTINSANENIQKILSAIPEKKHYKSSKRPIMIQGAMNVEMINQGTAGGYDSAVHQNYIVIGEKTLAGSAIKINQLAEGEGIGITNQEMRGVYAYDHEQKNFRRYTELLADTQLFRLAKKTADEHKNFNIKIGTISTADSWIESVDYINFLHEKYGSTCEEMETHAAAQICQNIGVPFIGIRVISNNILTAEKFDASTAYTCQDFVLLVVEKIIEEGKFN